MSYKDPVLHQAVWKVTTPLLRWFSCFQQYWRRRNWDGDVWVMSTGLRLGKLIFFDLSNFFSGEVFGVWRLIEAQDTCNFEDFSCGKCQDVKMSLILLGFGSKQDSRAFCVKKFLLRRVSDLAWDFFFCFWSFFSAQSRFISVGQEHQSRAPQWSEALLNYQAGQRVEPSSMVEIDVFFFCPSILKEHLDANVYHQSA